MIIFIFLVEVGKKRKTRGTTGKRWNKFFIYKNEIISLSLSLLSLSLSKRLQVAPERSPAAPALPRRQPQRELSDCSCRFVRAPSFAPSSSSASASASAGPQHDHLDAPARSHRRGDLRRQPRQRRSRGSRSPSRRSTGRGRRGGGGNRDGAERDDPVPLLHPGLRRRRGGGDVVDAREGQQAVQRHRRRRRASWRCSSGSGSGSGCCRCCRACSSTRARTSARVLLEQPLDDLLYPARQGLVVVHARNHEVAVAADRRQVEVWEREALGVGLGFCF